MKYIHEYFEFYLKKSYIQKHIIKIYIYFLIYIYHQSHEISQFVNESLKHI